MTTTVLLGNAPMGLFHHNSRYYLKAHTANGADCFSLDDGTPLRPYDPKLLVHPTTFVEVLTEMSRAGYDKGKEEVMETISPLSNKTLMVYLEAAQRYRGTVVSYGLHFTSNGHTRVTLQKYLRGEQRHYYLSWRVGQCQADGSLPFPRMREEPSNRLRITFSIPDTLQALCEPTE